MATTTKTSIILRFQLNWKLRPWLSPFLSFNTSRFSSSSLRRWRAENLQSWSLPRPRKPASRMLCNGAQRLISYSVRVRARLRAFVDSLAFCCRFLVRCRCVFRRELFRDVTGTCAVTCLTSYHFAPARSTRNTLHLSRTCRLRQPVNITD
jgi:hypothetical protein